MKLRISEGELRFRITRAELETLLQGTELTLRAPFVHQPQQYHIRTEKASTPLSLEETSTSISLMVNRDALQSFAKQLPSREGIEHTATLGNKNIVLVLEVDVRRSAS